MQQYRYRARSSTGRLVRGLLAAPDPPTARQLLRAQGHIILECHLARWSRVPPLPVLERQRLAQQLAQLLRAGLPLFEALQALEELGRGTRHHGVLAELVLKVQEGLPLSVSLAQQPQHFDTLFHSLVAAGEASGSLPDALERLAELLQRQQKIKRQLQDAFTYPVILLSLAFLVVLFLLLVAVPSMEPLLEGHRIEGVTAWILGASHTLRDHGIFLGALSLTAILALVSWSRSRTGRLAWRRRLSRLPGIGPVLCASALARTLRTMVTLARGGLSLLDALRLALRVATLPDLEQALQRIEAGLIQGASFSTLVAQETIFPSHVARMLSLAEEAGDLIPCLQQLASLYEEEGEQKVQKMQQLLQPVILLFLGCVVGLILVGILLPLTNVQQLVGGSDA